MRSNSRLPTSPTAASSSPGTTAAWCSCRDTMPGERVLARITDDAHDSFWRAETCGCSRRRPSARTHVWAAASVDREPGRARRRRRVRPHPARPPARAEAPGASSTRCSAWRSSTRDVDGRGAVRSGRDRRRHRLAHPRPPARRTRRRRRAVRRALAHTSSRSTDLPLATELVARVAPLGQTLPGRRVDRRRRDRTAAPATCSSTRRPCKRGRRTIRRAIVPCRSARWSASASSGSTRAASGRCTARAAATLTAGRAGAPSTRRCSTRARPTSTSTAGSACSPPPLGDRFGSTLRITTVESDERGDRPRRREPRRVARRRGGHRRASSGSCARWRPRRRPPSAPGCARRRSCSIRRGRARAARSSTRSPRSRPPDRLRRLRSGRARPRCRAVRRARLPARAPCAPSTCSRTPTTSRPWRLIAWPPVSRRRVPSGRDRV